MLHCDKSLFGRPTGPVTTIALLVDFSFHGERVAAITIRRDRRTRGPRTGVARRQQTSIEVIAVSDRWGGWTSDAVRRGSTGVSH
jgi:hypothetical protein